MRSEKKEKGDIVEHLLKWEQLPKEIAANEGRLFYKNDEGDPSLSKELKNVVSKDAKKMLKIITDSHSTDEQKKEQLKAFYLELAERINNELGENNSWKQGLRFRTYLEKVGEEEA